MNALFLVLALATPQVPDLGTRKAGHDWPGFLGPKRDGVSLEKGLDPIWPAAGPRVVWHRELGEGFGACAVNRGRVLQFDRVGGKARLLCLKSETGDPLWSFDYPTDYSDSYGAGDGPRTCPLVDGDRVFIVDPAGLLQCIGLGDGKLLWKKDTATDFGVVPNFFGVGSTPVVEGDLLLCMVGGSPPNSPTIGEGGIAGNGSGIVAFETATGKVRYKITDELASYSSPVTATIAGRRWGFVFARGGLVGFEPSTGKVDFHYPWRARAITTVNICTPVVAGDLVYVSEAYGIGGSVLRVKPGGYDVLWQDGRKRDQSMATYFGTPVQVGGFLYGSSGQGKSEAELRSVEMATGKVAWSEPGLGRTSLTSVDGHLVALSEDGTLRILRATPTKFDVVSKAVIKSPTGERLLGEPAWAAPVLSHGLLYVRGRDRLVCLDLIPER